MFSWKENLNKRSNRELLSLFKETKRINIDPQIYAGNLLHDRGYDLFELQKIKSNLKLVTSTAFENKQGKNYSEVIKENIIRQLFACTMIAAILVLPHFRFVSPNGISLPDEKIVRCIILTCLAYSPLLFIKKSNKRAVQKFEKDLQKKKDLLSKIDRELKF